MNLTDLLKLLSGKKTYFTIAAVFGLLFGSWQSWWKVPDEIYAALFALALAFIRSGVGKAGVGKAAGLQEIPIRRIAPKLMLILLVALTPGCRTADVARIASHLKDDPAIVSAQISSVYGTVKFVRVGGQTNSVTVSPDGTVSVNR